MLSDELAELRRRGVTAADSQRLPMLFGLLDGWVDGRELASHPERLNAFIEEAIQSLDGNPHCRTVLELFSLHPSTRSLSPTEARKIAVSRVRGGRASGNVVEAFAKNEQVKALAALAAAMQNIVVRSEMAALNPQDLPPELVHAVAKAGVTRFFSSREDYKLYRNGADSISRYVSTARRSIEMVSINLSTGHDMEEIADVFEHAISGPDHVHVTVSLLDPTLTFLMDSIAPVLGISTPSLVARISDTIDSLRDVRDDRLAKNRRGNLQVWCHRVLPNASAIILDGDHAETGRVQLETKGFRTGMSNSWGFEVGHGTTFYNTLRDSYRNLIADGRKVL